MGRRILSLNRSFRRVTKALMRVNFLFGFNKLFFMILPSLLLTSTTILVNGD